MKFRQLFLLSFICVTFHTNTIFAHSGRTDVQGGHHDYKNVSGLGDYHYHHGYSAHLHTNGICPYEATNKINEEVAQTKENPKSEEEPTNTICIIIQGKEMTTDLSPKLINNRVMIPVRPVFEYFDAKIDWNSGTNTITINKSNITLVMTIGKTDYLVNGISHQIDVPPLIIDGYTFVPTRCIAEEFGYKVFWNSISNTVEITENIDSEYPSL